MRAKSNLNKFNFGKMEDFSNLPTEISQFEIDYKEYSRFLIRSRRNKKMLRLLFILPIIGIYFCDKYSHRWFIMNKPFVYFINFLSTMVTLLSIITIFVL